MQSPKEMQASPAGAPDVPRIAGACEHPIRSQSDSRRGDISGALEAEIEQGAQAKPNRRGLAAPFYGALEG
jgi:hypothetical protein